MQPFTVGQHARLVFVLDHTPRFALVDGRVWLAFVPFHISKQQHLSLTTVRTRHIVLTGTAGVIPVFYQAPFPRRSRDGDDLRIRKRGGPFHSEFDAIPFHGRLCIP